MSSRKPMIVANWKMNTTAGQAAFLFNEIFEKLDYRILRQFQLVLCPPYIALERLETAYLNIGDNPPPLWLTLGWDSSGFYYGMNDFVEFCVQDIYPGDEGAVTGAISAGMLDDSIAAYCLVGHSERRRIFGETDLFIAQKIVSVAEWYIKPILCVGEDANTRALGNSEAEAFVCGQIRASLGQAIADGYEFDDPHIACTIAYEPVWSIGTGETATPEDAQAMAHAIREELDILVGSENAAAMQILYGGSVNAGNVASFANLPDIDGCLVGGASLDAREFVRLLRNFAEALPK